MNKRKLYLTIDDGPSIHMSDKIDYLINKNIPAILFCRGDYLSRFPSHARHAIKNGFIIGNHSYHHPSFNTLNQTEALDEISKTDILIENLYKDSGIKRPAKIFRFPYGHKGHAHIKAFQDILSTLGYRQPIFDRIDHPWFIDRKLHVDLDTSWTLDLEEYKTTDFQEIQEKISSLASSNENSNEIVLLHDHQKTSHLFYKIIDQLSLLPFDFKLPRFVCQLEN